MNQYNGFSSILILVFGLFVCSHSLAAGAGSAGKQVTDNDERQMDANGKLLIAGASYAKSWQVEQIAGRKVVNRGVAGSETGPMLERFESDIKDVKPDTVIVWGFINDIFRSKPDLLGQKIASTKENIATIVDICQKNGITPIVATEVTITSKNTWMDRMKSTIGRLLGKTSYADYVNKHVMETNRWLREYASQNNIKMLDFEKVLSDEGGERKREYAVEDGSHLSQQAYDALTEYMQSVEL